ncbi:reverse transcriptase/ribonuclease H, putative [Rhizoctonia solani AG-3 Rhs1AP]|uniref:Reverse transcriptase/ribonuclease H, putative n=2 Tax=Rhizoctonia solani AG-3 TaxID=1086053 RepID=X8J5Q3_9AGAM|nr:reverse transcriptase/ribonuclease H, putative [Rhizoctonia solani AG-3 Rhs1AP]KEP47452.1 putative reverse transcriptase/ribonuclease H [Rhizoctonia solani 123E]
MVAPNLASAKAHSTSCSRTANGYSHRDSECATSTTGLKVAHVPVAPLDSTIARCVETTHTRPSLAENDPRKIVTPLVPDTWESMLKTYDLWDDYEDVPTGLRYGFRIGVSSILNDTRIPKNHKSATDRPTVITRHINKEVSAGRYSGPFSLNTLTEIFGHFHAAPLGIIEKASSPGEFRVIQDFSFPRDTSYHSLNSQINPDNFPCDWGFFSNVAKIIATIDPASEAATFDVEAAYRQMPVHIDDQPRMVVIWNGFAWVDHCVPFGAASSNGIFARCGDAKRRVLELKFHTFVLKWVDDFLIFRIPSSKSPLKFTFGIDEILEFAIPLGWPWKESKTRPFASLFIYIGFEWNIRDRIVCIPLPKCQKYTRKIAEWIQSPKVTLRFTQTILGTLTHCALAVPEGRSRLSGISRFAATFSTAHQDRFKARTPSSWAKADAEWWLNTLQNTACSSPITPEPPPSACTIFVDASTSFGIGLTLDETWSNWRFTPGWDSDDRNIGWAEMVAVELGVLAAIDHGLSNISLTIRSDNQGVIHALDRGRSRNRSQNDALIRINAATMAASIHIQLVYVSSGDNIADGPSRGTQDPTRTLVNLTQYIYIYTHNTRDSRNKWHIHTSHVMHNHLIVAMPYQFSFNLMMYPNSTSGHNLHPIPTPNALPQLQALPPTSTNWHSSVTKPPISTTSARTPALPLSHLDTSIERALDHSLAPRTKSNYDSSVRKFATFCTEHGIKPEHLWPASEPALCAYAASFAGSYAGGTAASSIAALKAHHHRHNLPWAGSQRLSCVLKGVSRLAPPQLSDSKRPPVTLEMLSALHSDLKLSTSFDTAIFAIALVAFWSQCRLGELLGSSRLRHNPRTQPCRKDLIKAPSSLPDGLWKLNLPRTKTSFHSGEQVLIAHQTDPFDPTKALDALFQLNPNFPPSAHLFAYSCPKLGGPRNITREEFLDKCNSIWEKRGFPRFTGHSFRIGGTTELLASGTAPDIVKTTGRWTSNSYLKYWRGLDTIAANHIVRVSRNRS